MATHTPVVLPAPSKTFSSRLRGGDEAAWAITLFFALLILAVTALLVYELWIWGLPAEQKFGFSFLGSRMWNPVEDQFGALPFIYGTVLTSFLALLISVPLG